MPESEPLPGWAGIRTAVPVTVPMPAPVPAPPERRLPPADWTASENGTYYAPGHPLYRAAGDGIAEQADAGYPPSESYTFDPAAERFEFSGSNDSNASEPEGLTGAGAFGGTEDGGRRFGLSAFDPGRRGVRALAAVAAVVILIAAVLAWRSRPQIDPVAPPPLGAVQSESGDEPSAAVRGPSSAASEVVVAVGGKVRRPGLVRLAPGARVADALTAAGGADPGVDVAVLNLARKVIDGELIMVGVTPPPGVVQPSGPAASGPGAGTPLNLNTATLADLDQLPGVGPVLAQRILDARDAQGGFRAVGDLRKVDGIGDARYDQLKDLVTV